VTGWKNSIENNGSLREPQKEASHKLSWKRIGVLKKKERSECEFRIDK
jgi:hypothetical protein